MTNQKQSGRCWAFAGMNLIRVGAMQKMGLKDFEFSQNYVMFWDKFEKANWFLEAILQTAGRDADDRTVHYLLGRPVDDGGQWNMFVNLVRKYGLVPQTQMPETESSSSTGRLNQALLNELRQGARTLRQLAADGAGDDACRGRKKDILNTVYRILSIHLGTPPSSFLWQWKDKDKTFQAQRRDDAAGLPPPSTPPSRSMITSAWCTTRATPMARPTPWISSATSSAVSPWSISMSISSSSKPSRNAPSKTANPCGWAVTWASR